MSPPMPKMIADAVVLERTVRLLTTVDFVLVCLSNNKWLGVKYVLIVFGWTYVKGALLMISLNLINTVCISSKWLQKKQAVAKKEGGHPPRAPKSAPGFNGNINNYTPAKGLKIKWPFVRHF